MNDSIKKMLQRYQIDSIRAQENAIKEIIQEIVLLGLWRAKFFEHAAFYGGTALRLLYGSDRFSEDIDFSLLKADPDFRLTHYHQAVSDELESYGFSVSITAKDKSAKTDVQSAFIKTDTRHYDFEIKLDPRKKLKVKFEIDVNPPGHFVTEAKYLLHPTEFYVRTFSASDLFAGKLHAVLCRNWQHRVKGRDWYDMVWFVKASIPVHLAHLEARMRQTGHLNPDELLTEVVLRERLQARIHALDIDSAQKDIKPFIKDPQRIDIWSKEFFMDILSRIMVCAQFRRL